MVQKRAAGDLTDLEEDRTEEETANSASEDNQEMGGALMAEAKIMMQDVEDSIEAVKEGDPTRVKRMGVIAAIATIFSLLTVGILITALVYQCKYQKKKKNAAAQRECDIPLVESGSRRSQGSYRPNQH